MPISKEEFLLNYPKLYHVSLATDVESIHGHGLLSVLAILDMFEVTGSRRIELEGPRQHICPVSHPAHGTMFLNDHSPLHKGPLSRCLRDMSPQQWVQELNKRVFFFSNPKHVTNFLQAARARSRPRVLIEVETAKLFDIDSTKIHLCAINSGAATRIAPERGRETFASLEKYPFEEWKKKRRGFADAIAEVTFLEKVPPGGYLKISRL